MSATAAQLDILIEIKARLDELTKTGDSLKRATEQARGLGDMLKTGFAIDIARRGLGMLESALKGAFVEAFHLAGQIKDTSQALQMSAEGYQVLSLALKDAGGNVENLSQFVAANNRSLAEARDAGSSAAQAYRALGLDATRLAGLTVPERFVEIGRAVANSDDEVRAFAAASQALGSRNLPQLLSALRDVSQEGLQAFTQRMKEAGLIMSDETIDRLDRAQKTFEKMKRSMAISAGEKVGEVLDADPSMFGDLAKAPVWAMEQFARVGRSIGEFGGIVASFATGTPISTYDEVAGQDRERQEAEAARRDQAARERAARAAEFGQQQANIATRRTAAEDALAAAINERQLTEQLGLTGVDSRMEGLKNEIKARADLIELMKAEGLEGENEIERRRTIAALQAQQSFARADAEMGEKVQKYGYGFINATNAKNRAKAVNDPQANENFVGMGDGLAVGANNWAADLGSRGEQVAAAMQSTIGATVQSISDGIYGWITGTQTFGDVMRNLGSMVLQTFLQTIIQMGVQWVITHGIAKAGMIALDALQSVFLAKKTVEVNAAEAATMPAKTAGAAAASVSSFGIAAAIGIAAVIAMLAMFGREQGGPVKAGSPYIVGEKRPEVFVPSTSGTIVPSVSKYLSSMRGGTGYSAASAIGFGGSGGGGGGSGAAAARPLQVIAANSMWEARAIQRNAETETVILDVFRDNRHQLLGR